MFDTHTHVQFSSFAEDRASILLRCKEKNMILNCIGTQTDTSEEAVALALAHDWIYASVGLHPIQSKKVSVHEEYVDFVARGEDFDMDFYDALVARGGDKVIAMGETGLDAFHVPKDISIENVFDDQWELFLKHVALAQKYNLPLVIHTRDGALQEDGSFVSAHEELIKRLRSFEVQKVGSVDVEKTSKLPTLPPSKLHATVHCYTGDWKHAQEYLNMGFYLGFTGVITFPPKKSNPKAQEDLLEVVDKMPIDRILVETDAPFLAPNAYRGKRCEPWMVEETIAFIAQRRGVTTEEMTRIVTENGKQLFSKVR